MVCGVGRSPAGILRDVSYAVQTDVFEGPFDLLLHLITKQRVDIYDVSLASITEETVSGFLMRLREGDGEHPPRGLSCGFTEEKFADLVHLGIVLGDPVQSRYAAIEIAVIHIAADLLRTDQTNFQFIIINNDGYKIEDNNYGGYDYGNNEFNFSRICSAAEKNSRSIR